jgi:hypothetical protein
MSTQARPWAPVRVRITGMVNGQPTPHAGQYLVDWQFNSATGAQRIVTAEDPRDAPLCDPFNALDDMLNLLREHGLAPSFLFELVPDPSALN